MPFQAIIKGLLYSSVFLMLSCSGGQHKKTGPTIHGKVNYPGNGFIYLEIFTPGGFERIDSAKLSEDHSFTLRALKNTQEIYQLNFFQKQKNTIVLGDQDVWIMADGNISAGGFSAKGTKEIAVISTSIGLKNENKIAIELLNQKIKTAQSKYDTVELRKLYHTYKLRESNFKSSLQELIRSQNGSLAALHMLYENFNIEPNLEFYDEQMPNIREHLVKNWYMDQVYVQYFDTKKLAIGSISPDFSLPDPNGKAITLSSFRGKYLYLDFWASWCQPCRIENPDLVKVYGLYKSENFEILGVSFDKKKENWIKAIEHDGLEWQHVSDLKYFDSEMIDLYNITNVPTTLLLDPEGRIIAKNIKSHDLEAILKGNL